MDWMSVLHTFLYLLAVLSGIGLFCSMVYTISTSDKRGVYYCIAFAGILLTAGPLTSGMA